MSHRFTKLQVFLVIVTFASFLAYGGSQKDWTTKRGIPTWNTGDWWIISSDILTAELNNPNKPRRIGGTRNGPRKLCIFSVSLLFRVGEVNNVDGDICDLIEIFPYELPTDVNDDSGGEPLWRLFIRQEDGSLAKIEWNLRQWPYYVTGAVTKKGDRTYEGHSSVVNLISQLFPLDIPYLSPHSIHEHNIDYTEVETGKKSTETCFVITTKDIEFIDGRNKKKFTQTVDVIEDIVFGKRQEVLTINFVDEEDRTVRTQTWVAGYPWWVQCSRQKINGEFEHGKPIRSRMVEFGNKEQKPTAKNIDSGNTLPAPVSHE